MSDLKKYIKERKIKDKEFALNFDEGYEEFKVGVMLKELRETAGMTQEELANIVGTKKTAISRLENHSGDIKISTLKRVALALGKELKISIA